MACRENNGQYSGPLKLNLYSIDQTQFWKKILRWVEFSSKPVFCFRGFSKSAGILESMSPLGIILDLGS